jgi:hypothetical protein
LNGQVADWNWRLGHYDDDMVLLHGGQRMCNLVGIGCRGDPINVFANTSSRCEHSILLIDIH